jgi:hypothetical protein
MYKLYIKQLTLKDKNMRKLLLILFIVPLLSSTNIKVYVCTGTTSKKYHNSTQCKGVLASKGTTYLVTLVEAKNLGKTPCGFCFPSNNLKQGKIKSIKKGEVYICTSNTSKRYHNSIKCKGMQACRGTIAIVTLVNAKNTGKTPCRFCFSSDNQETKSEESDIDKEWWGDKYP